MTLELSDAELATAATAGRPMAYQEGERAQKMENPTLHGPLEANAKRFAVLAEKLEASPEERAGLRPPALKLRRPGAARSPR